jgi:hypothetical protein
VDDVGYGPEGPVRDAGGENSVSNDADAAAAGYFAFGDTTRWEGRLASDFGLLVIDRVCAVFDGRYVTFAPYYTVDATLRYDTTAPFTVKSSWLETPFAIPPEAGNPTVSGCAFDGAHVFFSTESGPTQMDLLFYRDAGDVDWANLDLSGAEAGVKHTRPTTDGRYVYVPARTSFSAAPTGVVVRADVRALPASVTTTFDVGSLETQTAFYTNSLYDGRYLYLVPSYNGSPPQFRTARVDVAEFADAGSWEVFDLTLMPNTPAEGYASATFDGTYVYYWGAHYSGSANALVVRYDTRVKFDEPTSWKAVDFRPADGDAGLDGPAFFDGSTFDGRYIYTVVDNLTGDTIAIWRYDTTKDFDPASFERIALPEVLPNIRLPAHVSLTGAAFDGSHVYFAPIRSQDTLDSLLVRFHAKDPPSMPPSSRATFY